MKKILLFTLVIALGAVACKNKKEAKQEPVVNQVIEPIKPDTIAEVIEEEVVEEEPEPVVYTEPVAPSKYFLISGSFIEYSNAQKYHQELINQGLTSEIIERPFGPNGEYYKVSYMGFSSWNEAVETLRRERQLPGKDSVWLLVKN